ncbi:hypothetical protein HL658_12100 [Azospirillum sp. RWY-5-1]|uniref:Uncharacterized protein n=1 Tax=Azospirillum oleiclasticum TaxID=2735135 RepID=A0ABX2T810_9PROT|nr:hypothetical protein [Azospirillum oleiclasticum]NYZ13295.1 hypothetical protein [Azospirillum oleiclasticum]NYZ20456.1 hypothetical protein [Azospirillum oleiclasticum]
MIVTRRKKDQLYKDEVDLESRLAERLKLRRMGLGRKKKKVSYAKFFMTDPADVGMVEEEPMEDLDDDTWEPPARSYNINMRLTTGLFRMTCRMINLIAFNQAMTKERSQLITGVAGREPCCDVMGIAINGKGKVSAAHYASSVGKWPDLLISKKTKDPKQKPEWCHLIADSLGGPTAADNLVAASYGANTYMAVIEALLKGHTALRVTVKAYCSADHFAELIVYKIDYNHHSISFDIDGRNYNFTIDDMKDVQDKLNAWLKQHKVP